MRYTQRTFLQVYPVGIQRLFTRRAKRRRSTDRLEAFTSQIGASVLLQGSISGRGNYLVQGEIVGDGEIDGAVVLAAGSCWKGNVSADYVQVAGKIEGTVTARAKLELASTAVVTGDLSSPVIAIAEGAVYEGRISRPRKTQVTRYSERRGADESDVPA